MAKRNNNNDNDKGKEDPEQISKVQRAESEQETHANNVKESHKKAIRSKKFELKRSPVNQTW